MIDINKSKKIFQEYVNNYDSTNGKIALKISHIIRVAEISKNIAINNNLPKEDVELAELIGLLHDIGRFEQVRLYNTFRDKYSVDHAQLGVKILFEDGLINKFEVSKEDGEIIKKAILNHNKSLLPDNLDKREEIFSKIIRDADKVDIFYVLITDELINCYGKENFSEDYVSDTIYNQFKNNHMIKYSDRKTYADLVVGHISFVFDFNYDYCLQIVKDEKYLERLIEKINFTNEDTINKMNEFIEIANDYMDKRLSNKA